MSAVLSDPLRPLAEVLKPDDRALSFEPLEVLHERLSTLVLHGSVPIDVRQLFETAKNLRLYTYFVYPFHQAAELHVFQALERSLRHRLNDEVVHLASIDDPEYPWPGLALLLKHADMAGWIHNEGFSTRSYRARSALRDERAIAGIQEMLAGGSTSQTLTEPTEAEVHEVATGIDTVRLLVNCLPTWRNELGHGSARLSPTSDLLMQDVCDAINMIFDGAPSKRVEPLKRPNMHGRFKEHTAALESKRLELFAMNPVTRDGLPNYMPSRGVYVFFEKGRPLYVGRSNCLRKRIGRHCRAGARHNMASFAYRLAIEQCNLPKPTYRKGEGRATISMREDVAAQFAIAKARIRNMQVRFVEEGNPVRQMLLEAYIAIVHETPYNDFDNH